LKRFTHSVAGQIAVIFPSAARVKDQTMASRRGELMPSTERRSFSREFKLKVIERLEAGESGTALALELSIKRTIIYRWRDADSGPSFTFHQ
jgi:hypothetical protein